MKHKTITTDKATLMVVECPKTYSLFHDEDWQLLGRMSDITEEHADGAVEKLVFEDEEFGDIIKYRDYTAIPIGKHNKCYAPITALKSLSSLLQANEVYFENRELKWKTFDTEEKYKQAQSKVWDKERTYLFIKVD